MQGREEVRQNLKQQIKDQIFMTKFDEQVGEEIKRAISGTKYAERVNEFDYYLGTQDKRLKRFTIEGDDELKTLKWQSFLKDCGHYYDKPRFDQERRMRQNLQFKYDDLFQNGIFPKLQDRQTLLTWACQSWEADKKARAPEDQRDAINDNCENYDKLLRKYGPSYEGLK